MKPLTPKDFLEMQNSRRPIEAVLQTRKALIALSNSLQDQHSKTTDDEERKILGREKRRVLNELEVLNKFSKALDELYRQSTLVKAVVALHGEEVLTALQDWRAEQVRKGDLSQWTAES